VIPAVAGSTNAGTAEPVSTTLGSLTPGTTVFYRLKATNSVGTIYGSGGSFTTLQPPAVVTQTAIAITTTGATLTGTVNPNGSAASWQYEYGPDTNYGQVSPTLPGTTGTGNSPETVPTNLSGLTPGATLHYRLKATNGSGTVYGADMTFTTKQPPTVVTGLASSITASGAVLNATVNPRGAASTWQIEYGTTTAYGQSLPVTPGDAGNGTAAVNVNVPVTGLQPNTVYHFRVKATSTYGTSNGSDAVFTTNNNILGWRQLNFGTTANTGDAADNADPDHDGIVNLLEYGYGMNPKVRDSALLPRPTYNGNTLITSFNQPAGVNDVTYGAEVSTSLQSWSPIADSGSGGAHTFAAPFSSAGKHYMRLKVTLIP
jgi:phosphodiesterase/alkaline phosphatase D-like protein